jgi:hypothetical protein
MDWFLKQDVLEFQVSVDYFFAVAVLDCFQQLSEYLLHFELRHPTVRVAVPVFVQLTPF